MKKIALIFICVLFTQISFSQVSKNNLAIDTSHVKVNYTYCEILGTGGLFSTKVKIDIDYGQEVSFWNQDRRLKDEQGKSIKFNSMVDALNYMGTLGWEFVQAYVVTSSAGLGGQQNVYHWLLKRELSKEIK
jgi:hypothetical protein